MPVITNVVLFVNLTAAAGSGSHSDVVMKFTELCEPTGDVMLCYVPISFLLLMNA